MTERRFRVTVLTLEDINRALHIAEAKLREDIRQGKTSRAQMVELLNQAGAPPEIYRLLDKALATGDA